MTTADSSTKSTEPAHQVLAAHSGSRHRSHEKEVIASLKMYTPNAGTKEWARVQAFVVDVAMRAADQSSYPAARLLRITGPFVLWCVGGQGLPLQPEVIFAPRTIDAYCNQGWDNRGTRGTYRAALMRVSETLLPESNGPAMTPIGRRTIQSPYSATEMKQYRAWARGQHTLNNRHKAMMMLAFSAGAGLWPAEIGLVLREDITTDESGIVITVRGKSPRQVPLLRRWERWVLEVAQTRNPGEPMWGSTTRNNNKNTLTNFTSRSMGKAPTNARLRATWITGHLAMGTPMKALLQALGTKQFSNVHYYLDYIDDLDPVKYRQALRGKVSE